MTMRSKIGQALFFLSFVLVVGCTAGSGMVGVPSPSPGTASTPPPLPSTDAGLAEHVPQQVVIGYVQGAQVQQLVNELKGTVLREFKQHNAVLVGLPQGASLVDTIRKLQGMSRVKYAEPNYVYRAFQSVTPNDPFFATKQWGPQQINAPAAWAITQGNANSVVAVVDTGVSSTHPEFISASSISKLLTGTNCVVATNSTDDDNGHGTHVAGIAAAIGNNGIGIAGIAWAANIIPIKVLDSTGSGTTGTITCGIDFGASFPSSHPGVQVVENLSLGGPGYSQLMKDAVDFALQNNVVVVAAAGNDGKATVLFPAGYPGVMAVGAITPTGARAAFSTYGSHLSVVAPGVDIYSTLPGASYGYESGTSMAAPHVSGVIALIRAQNLSANLTPAQVRSQIEQTATRSGGFNLQVGWGIVNAGAAVGSLGSNTYGGVTVSVQVSPGVPALSGTEVIIWGSTPTCTNLTQEVKTAQTNLSGAAVFNDIPAGSYCASASESVGPKGTTPTPFMVNAGQTTPVTVFVM